MFTGIIQDLGKIKHINALGKGKHVTISCSSQITTALKLGDSISVNGVCSTALNLTKTSFSVDYLEETLLKTTFGSIQTNDSVNLELSLTPQSRMGGHFVTGHVDETGTILSLTPTSPWAELVIQLPSESDKWIIPKGSIAIDGISLTIGKKARNIITLFLIPHTLSHTTLGTKNSGDLVNLEYDMLGKYVYNFYQSRSQDHDQ